MGRPRRNDGQSWIQREFPFLERSRRLDRAFKRIITGVTILGVFGLMIGTRTGRDLGFRAIYESRKTVVRLLGFPEDRQVYEAERDRNRARGITQAREALADVEAQGGETMRQFLRVAKMDHATAVLRWGNVDYTLALSSDVFEPDDSGRSYRLRPNTRSIWLINLTLYRTSAMFEIPDTPEARRLGEAVGGRVVPESIQTTNSWGCRGPEPDPKAPVRGIVLGDSNMQGLLVGDDQTPPFRLEVALKEKLGVPVSILNTGVLGYSPEQYYYSLMAFYEMFQPRFVVISLCDNDFGDMSKPEGWAEAEYWLDQISQFCRTRGLVCLAVPVPREDALTGRRNETVFPGQVTKIFDGGGHFYLNLTDEFANEHLKLRARALRDGKQFLSSPLFNRKYSGDNHLSPLGCELWARAVARRLELIWESAPVPPSWINRTGL